MTTPDPSTGAANGPAGMSRRQLLRHTAWFGAAVVLTVTGGEVISHLGTSPTAAPAAVATDRTRCGLSKSVTATSALPARRTPT